MSIPRRPLSPPEGSFEYDDSRSTLSRFIYLCLEIRSNSSFHMDWKIFRQNPVLFTLQSFNSLFLKTNPMHWKSFSIPCPVWNMLMLFKKTPSHYLKQEDLRQHSILMNFLFHANFLIKCRSIFIERRFKRQKYFVYILGSFAYLG